MTDELNFENLNICIEEDFWNDFIQEAFEHIDDIEMNVLTLEKEPANMEIIHSMFRAFHTIKGLSGFVEHILIQEIAHKTETLMDYCRKEESDVTPPIIEAILKSSDYIKNLCSDLDAWKDLQLQENIKIHTEFLNTLVQEIEDKLNGTGAEEAQIEQESVAVVEQEALTPEYNEGEIIMTQENRDPDGFMSEDFEGLRIPEEEICEQEIEIETECEEEETENTEEKESVPEPQPAVQAIIPVQNVMPANEVKTVAVSAPNSPKPKCANEEYMKVSNSRIDHLVDIMGEFIINQSLLKEYVMSHYSQDDQLIKNFDSLLRITRELQDISMFLRLVSLKPTFQKMTRIARDTINELNKDIEFVTTGESTEIDRVVADKLLEPLVHLIKNAISHGIEENPLDRTKTNKSPKGRVELNAYNKRGKIYIEVKDDGAGINTDIVYKKAIEKGIIDPDKEYSQEEIKEFIMLPGFSTAQKVDNISGRGVGMDVVKTQIAKIGGKISIKSEQGKGSTFTLAVPVNHAIMNGIIIDILDEHFIIPTVNVKEIIQPEEKNWIYTNNKRTMLNVRDKIVPVVMPSKLFKKFKDDEAFPIVMLLELDQEYRALPITNVINRQEVVVKPADEEFAGLKYLSGMSILGNGQVSLILDVPYMFEH